MDKAYRLPNTNRQTHPCCVGAVRPCMVLDACPYWPTPPPLMHGVTGHRGDAVAVALADGGHGHGHGDERPLPAWKVTCASMGLALSRSAHAFSRSDQGGPAAARAPPR